MDYRASLPNAAPVQPPDVCDLVIDVGSRTRVAIVSAGVSGEKTRVVAG